ncbi:MAG: DUF4838 domain-containing protein [Saprospiraceae bacterium]|nr:DUF4838 domain-containing protein [Saprospiraceae bacterium]
MKKFCSHFGISYFLLFGTIILLLATAQDVYAQTKKKKSGVVAPIPPKEPEPTYQLHLTNQGNTLYRLVLPVHATKNELYAAEVLQKYILQISGAALPILHSDQGISPYEILIGQNERLNELDRVIDLNGLKKAGFHILTDQTRLIIAGGLDKGSLYGVYTFLENYLQCRLYSPGVKIIPKQTQIVLPAIDDRQVPVIDFRDTHYKVTWDKEYIDWHKLNHDEQGGRSAWGSWVHTFNDLLPPDIYYQDHPEYFAEVRGKRIPTQPCLSNPAVLEIVNQNLRKKIAENPGAQYWSVSQNDNRDYCTCDQCRKIDESQGSPSGSIIRFVNEVAAQFPDKLISTLAYEYGRHAPKTLIPAENVNIMLCSIEALRHKPIAEDSASMDFVKDLEDWGRIAKDIIIWDYVIQFPNLLAPFPNLHVLQPNIQLFVKNGVNAMFEQGNREVGGEFAELRAYLISKLLWDPNLSVDSLMEDFLYGYYGAAGSSIKKYIVEMETALRQSGKPLRIFGSPIEADQSYLTPDLLKRYNILFDEAEMAVKDSASLLERVRISRLPIQFAIMEQAKKNWTGEQGLFVKQDNQWEVRTSIRAMIDPFTDLCIRQGVTRVKEWSTSPEEYRASMYRLFSKGMNEHLAFGKPVIILSPDSNAITPAQKMMLTDGIRGGHDYAYNWMTTQGKDLEVIIDLEEVKLVHRIESAYFQYAFWLRILPVRVEYATSADGLTYVSAGSIENTLPIDQYGGQQRDFISEFDTRKARYIKIKAVSLGNTPGWHPGAGRPANMSIDEIVVE